MTGLIGRIARRQIVPRSARAQNPKYTVQYRARVLPRSASPIFPRLGRNNGSRTAHWASVRSMLSIYAISHNLQLAQSLKCVYEITSSIRRQKIIPVLLPTKYGSITIKFLEHVSVVVDTTNVVRRLYSAVLDGALAFWMSRKFIWAIGFEWEEYLEASCQQPRLGVISEHQC